MNKRKTGQEQEAKAACFLKTQGYQILEQNYRCKRGEIDLVAREGQYLVFVEVKLRKSDRFAAAAEYVDRRKQERIKSTAQMWLSTHPSGLQPRFDVIEIYAPEGVETRRPKIYHWEDAFS